MSNNNNNNNRNHNSVGANYVLNGNVIYQEIRSKRPDLAQLLTTVPVDHTERSDSGVAQGVESVRPIWEWIEYDKNHPDNDDRDEDDEALSKASSSWWDTSISQRRLCWRRMVPPQPPVPGTAVESLWQVVEENDNHNHDNDTRATIQDAIAYLNQTIHDQARAAPRFCLQTGEALLVDNYVMLHARDGFSTLATTTTASTTTDRWMWRVWVWTQHCRQVPPEILLQQPQEQLQGTRTAAPATVHAAGQALRESGSAAARRRLVVEQQQ
mmetsp:Transcript_17395/g.40463  ORF Transcript_17395/g.40463 Transcript_17395/m.40463 type:complete len:269 (+) Transcript_17395:857-1663(+)